MHEKILEMQLGITLRRSCYLGSICIPTQRLHLGLVLALKVFNIIFCMDLMRGAL